MLFKTMCNSYTLITVDGGYSKWGQWSDCSKSCGGGKQFRVRTCTNPPPSAGGKNCSALEETLRTRDCVVANCPGKKCY